MALVLVASCRNWHNFTHFLKHSARKLPLASFAVDSQLSGVNTVSCLPILRWAAHNQSSHYSSCSCSRLRRWQPFVDFHKSLGRVRNISSSKIVCVHDVHDKESGTTTTANKSDGRSSDDNVDSVDSTSNSLNVSGSKAGPADEPQPVTAADVDKELLRYDYEEFELIPDEEVSIVQPVKEAIPVELKRGTTGVFDVEEVVDLLEDENAKDICVIRVPPELKYVSFMVIATGRSTRHIRAMAAYIKWVYKRKRSSFDPASVKIEGELTNDWFAIDLGNIAVHLFLEKTRHMYDLETLWTVGAEHDDLSQDIMDEVTTSTTLDDFSFDAELERLRKLRGYGATDERSED